MTPVEGEPIGLDDPITRSRLQKRITQAVDARAHELGLRFEPQRFWGERMVFIDRRELRLDLAPGYWREMDADDEPAIIAAAIEMIEEFALRHGPGAAWRGCDFDTVHIVVDDGHTVYDGRIRLRRYLAHEAEKMMAPMTPKEIMQGSIDAAIEAYRLRKRVHIVSMSPVDAAAIADPDHPIVTFTDISWTNRP